jgi:hypothetical protein
MSMANSPCTARDAAAEIVALINSSPRSPRQDEIEAIIAKAAAPSVGEHRPITGPVQINFDVPGFASRWLPIAAMAVKLLAKDKAELQEFARCTFKGEIDGVLAEDAFHHFVDDLEELESKLRALAHFTAVAKNRMAIWVSI